jgi:hypothetical protein
MLIVLCPKFSISKHDLNPTLLGCSDDLKKLKMLTVPKAMDDFIVNNEM